MRDPILVVRLAMRDETEASIERLEVALRADPDRTAEALLDASDRLAHELATDPGAIKDFEAFCKTTGYRLLAAGQDGEVLTFDIQKTA